jgi:hypothetical protein
MSPLGNLLEWLAVHYNLLFVASAERPELEKGEALDLMRRCSRSVEAAKSKPKKHSSSKISRTSQRKSTKKRSAWNTAPGACTGTCGSSTTACESRRHCPS